MSYKFYRRSSTRWLQVPLTKSRQANGKSGKWLESNNQNPGQSPTSNDVYNWMLEQGYKLSIYVIFNDTQKW